MSVTIHTVGKPATTTSTVTLDGPRISTISAVVSTGQPTGNEVALKSAQGGILTMTTQEAADALEILQAAQEAEALEADRKQQANTIATLSGQVQELEKSLATMRTNYARCARERDNAEATIREAASALGCGIDGLVEAIKVVRNRDEARGQTIAATAHQLRADDPKTIPGAAAGLMQDYNEQRQALEESTSRVGELSEQIELLRGSRDAAVTNSNAFRAEQAATKRELQKAEEQRDAAIKQTEEVRASGDTFAAELKDARERVQQLRRHNTYQAQTLQGIRRVAGRAKGTCTSGRHLSPEAILSILDAHDSNMPSGIAPTPEGDPQDAHGDNGTLALETIEGIRAEVRHIITYGDRFVVDSEKVQGVRRRLKDYDKARSDTTRNEATSE